MRGWTLLRGTYWTLVSSPLSLGRRGSFRPRCLLPPLRDGHSWPQSRAGPHPRRPLPAALLTGLRGRALGNPKAVHLAEVAGQQAHARRRQDHGAQAPESALGGESRGADRVGLGERARARAWGPGTGEGLGPGRPSVISRGATLSSHATPNLSLPCTTEPPPQKPENTPIQTSCPQDPRPPTCFATGRCSPPHRSWPRHPSRPAPRTPAPASSAPAPLPPRPQGLRPAPPGRRTTRSARRPARRTSSKSFGRPRSARPRADFPRASGGGACPAERPVSRLRGASPTSPALRPPAQRTHVVPVPVLVALAAVAAGEGHTVGVNVQLTHWGAGRVRASRRCPPTLPDPFSPASLLLSGAAPPLTAHSLTFWGPTCETGAVPPPSAGWGPASPLLSPPGPPQHAACAPAVPCTRLPASPPPGAGSSRIPEPHARATA